MTSVHSNTSHSFARPVLPYAGSPGIPRKNSMMSGPATPVLSSFAIDLIAQFDNYRVNMRETLQREVEENIHKAKILKEAMKESSDLEAQQQALTDQELMNKDGGSTSSNRSRTSLHRLQQNGHAPHQLQQLPSQQTNGKALHGVNGVAPEKRSRLDRLLGRKGSAATSNMSIKTQQVAPHPVPQPLHEESNGSVAHSSSSEVDHGELKYLRMDETDEEEEIQVLDRSMPSGAAPHVTVAEGPSTEVKLHPTRAKTFSLPKSLRNLKRRIAALRAKGTDLDAEAREKEERERERAANGGTGEEKKKFTLIRLLPWKSSKKPSVAAVTTTGTAATGARVTATGSTTTATTEVLGPNSNAATAAGVGH